MRDAVLVLIGDELLHGYVQDRNSKVIADKLRRAGYELRSIVTVADDVPAIRDAVQRELTASGTRLVVTCGGVGPTPDDVTYQAVAEALSQPLQRHDRISEWVRAWSPTTWEDEALQALDKMAWIPAGGRLVAPDAIGGPLVTVDVERDGLGPATVLMFPGSPDLVHDLLEHASVAFPRVPSDALGVQELPHHLPEVLLSSCFRLVAEDHPTVHLGSYPGDPMILRLEGPPREVVKAATAVRRRLDQIGAEFSQTEALERSRLKERVLDAARALADGGMVVVVDDDDRENEADLVVAASSVTAEQMGFIIRHTSGIVCVPMESSRADALNLEPMVETSTDPHGTAFSVSVDHVSTGTGVSAADRVRTVRGLAGRVTRPEELRRPGHVFPLRAREGGVLKRAGHTEAAVDLLRLAGAVPVGVISELTCDDGRMMRGTDVAEFASRHGLPVVAVADVVRYRRASETLVRRSGEASIPTEFGEFRAVAYQASDDEEHLALTLGDVAGDHPDGVLVRVHSECLTGDVLWSRRCDCGHQLRSALERIASEGAGAVVYLRGHEGRGIGLGHKLRAYALQEAGHDTVTANLQLGLPVDDRDYGIGAHILADLGIRRLRLMTNNPSKYSGLDGHDLEIVGRVPIPPVVTDENLAYLLAKRDLMGHQILMSFDR